MNWGFLLLWCVPQSLLLKKTAPQHEAATSTLYFWDGTLQLLSRAGSFHTWCLELRFNRPENIVSHSLSSEGPLGAVLQIAKSMFSRVFTEERIEFGQTATKTGSVECCGDVCPSVDFSYLHIQSWSSTRVTIRFLVTSLDNALFHFHQLFNLVRRPALGRVWYAYFCSDMDYQLLDLLLKATYYAFVLKQHTQIQGVWAHILKVAILTSYKKMICRVFLDITSHIHSGDIRDLFYIL